MNDCGSGYSVRKSDGSATPRLHAIGIGWGQDKANAGNVFDVALHSHTSSPNTFTFRLVLRLSFILFFSPSCVLTSLPGIFTFLLNSRKYFLGLWLYFAHCYVT